MTHMDSGMFRGLDYVESQKSLRVAAAHKELFSKEGLRCSVQGPCMRSGPANKEGGMRMQFGPTQCTSWTDQRGAK